MSTTNTFQFTDADIGGDTFVFTDADIGGDDYVWTDWIQTLLDVLLIRIAELGEKYRAEPLEEKYQAEPRR